MGPEDRSFCVTTAPRRVNWPGVVLVMLCVVSAEVVVVLIWRGLELL